MEDEEAKTEGELNAEADHLILGYNVAKYGETWFRVYDAGEGPGSPYLFEDGREGIPVPRYDREREYALALVRSLPRFRHIDRCIELMVERATEGGAKVYATAVECYIGAHVALFRLMMLDPKIIRDCALQTIKGDPL